MQGWYLFEISYTWYRNSLNITSDLSKNLPYYFSHSGFVQRLHTRNKGKWCSTQLILLITILKGGWKVSDFFTNVSCTGNSLKKISSIWSYLILYICNVIEMHTTLALYRPIHTYHAIPLPCHATKGLDCVFPNWFTQCCRILFTHAMPKPCHSESDFSRPRHSTA
jgi:hypothetical protein